MKLPSLILKEAREEDWFPKAIRKHPMTLQNEEMFWMQFPMPLTTSSWILYINKNLIISLSPWREKHFPGNLIINKSFWLQSHSLMTYFFLRLDGAEALVLWPEESPSRPSSVSVTILRRPLIFEFDGASTVLFPISRWTVHISSSGFCSLPPFSTAQPPSCSPLSPFSPLFAKLVLRDSIGFVSLKVTVADACCWLFVSVPYRRSMGTFASEVESRWLFFAVGSSSHEVWIWALHACWSGTFDATESILTASADASVTNGASAFVATPLTVISSSVAVAWIRSRQSCWIGSCVEIESILTASVVSFVAIEASSFVETPLTVTSSSDYVSIASSLLVSAAFTSPSVPCPISSSLTIALDLPVGSDLLTFEDTTIHRAQLCQPRVIFTVSTSSSPSFSGTFAPTCSIPSFPIGYFFVIPIEIRFSNGLISVLQISSPISAWTLGTLTVTLSISCVRPAFDALPRPSSSPKQSFHFFNGSLVPPLSPKSLARYLLTSLTVCSNARPLTSSTPSPSVSESSLISNSPDRPLELLLVPVERYHETELFPLESWHYLKGKYQWLYSRVTDEVYYLPILITDEVHDLPWSSWPFQNTVGCLHAWLLYPKRIREGW